MRLGLGFLCAGGSLKLPWDVSIFSALWGFGYHQRRRFWSKNSEIVLLYCIISQALGSQKAPIRFSGLDVYLKIKEVRSLEKDLQ
jgi:hypothetical protein